MEQTEEEKRAIIEARLSNVFEETKKDEATLLRILEKKRQLRRGYGLTE